MEDQFKDKDNDNTGSVPAAHPEKKSGSPYVAFILSMFSVVYLYLVVLTEGLFLIISILLFPIILSVLIAAIIGMVMGLVFLVNRSGNSAEKTAAACAVALPALTALIAVIHFSGSTTSVSFSM